MNEALSVFGRAFDESETFNSRRPCSDYMESLLDRETFIMLVALEEDAVVGALTAYELKKYEQEWSEIYIYDLAVEEAFRRRGIATALLRHLSEIAVRINAKSVYVQADKEDLPAVSLYESLGSGREVLHFDLTLPEKGSGK